MVGILVVFSFIGSAQANEDEIAAAVKRLFGMQATAVHESLIPGLYGINTSITEIGPRFFMDRDLSVYGNFKTGYTHLSGPQRGQDLSPQEANKLFMSMLAAIPKERLLTHRYGNGSREVLLFTAYDCPSCRGVEKTLQQQAKQLNVTVYMVPTALRYETDASSRKPIQALICDPNPESAWQNLILKGQAPVSDQCAKRADDYAYLSRAFPVDFPVSVPTAVTLADGKIFVLVQQHFGEIFKGR